VSHDSSQENPKPGRLASFSANLRAARRFAARNKHLFQLEIWQEIWRELPRRARVSLVLIIVLVGVVLWAQSKIFAPPTLSLSSTLKRTRVVTPSPAIILTPPATKIALLVSNPLPAKLDAGATTPTQSPGLKIKPTPFFTIHTVQADETLISIAAKYNVTTEDLLATNEIRDPTGLEEGQHLLIPPDDKFFRGKIILHELKKGDTLLGIASKYGSSVRAIDVANPHLDFKALSAGETIAVPVIFTDTQPATVEEPKDVVYHTVQAGEIPLTIASQYDIPVEILLTANNIDDPTLLQIGQQLIIPPHDGITLGFPVILYELTPSDTLVGIASRFGSSVKDILAVNPDLDPAALEAGQLVAIPVIFAPVRRPTPTPAGPPPPPPPPPPSLADLAQEVIAAVNLQRENQGLPLYVEDAQLDAIALDHAQDMFVRDFFAHVSPDGGTLEDRLVAGGVTGYLAAGENIQRNTQPRARTAQVAVDWFMNSRPHRHNILHERHNRIGVGAVEGPPGWFTFVLVFAHR
jgi:uncharacterized protein YkwD